MFFFFSVIKTTKNRARLHVVVVVVRTGQIAVQSFGDIDLSRSKQRREYVFYITKIAISK